MGQKTVRAPNYGEFQVKKLPEHPQHSKLYQSRRFPQLNNLTRESRLRQLIERAPSLQRETKVQKHAIIAVGVAFISVFGLYYMSYILDGFGETPQRSTDSFIVIEQAGDIPDSEWMRLIHQVQAETDAAELESAELEQQVVAGFGNVSLEEVDTNAFGQSLHDRSWIEPSVRVEPAPVERLEIPLPPPELGLE
jgi:hypothetical protein